MGSLYKKIVMRKVCSCQNVLLRVLLGLLSLNFYPIILLKPLLLIWISGSAPGVQLTSSGLNSKVG